MHKYIPDFKVGNEYWEIKGNQFLKEDGTWRNPYAKDDDGLTEAKHQFCLREGIRILFKDEVKTFQRILHEELWEEVPRKLEKILKKKEI